MNLKEQLEYRKEKHKELMTILKDLKKLRKLSAKAKEIGVNPSVLTHLKKRKNLKIEIIEKYIKLLK